MKTKSAYPSKCVKWVEIWISITGQLIHYSNRLIWVWLTKICKARQLSERNIGWTSEGQFITFTSISCTCSWFVEYNCFRPCSSSWFLSSRTFPNSAAKWRSVNTRPNISINYATYLLGLLGLGFIQNNWLPLSVTLSWLSEVGLCLCPRFYIMQRRFKYYFAICGVIKGLWYRG